MPLGFWLSRDFDASRKAHHRGNLVQSLRLQLNRNVREAAGEAQIAGENKARNTSMFSRPPFGRRC